MKFEGIITPVITPFFADGSIDFASYAQHVAYLQDAGVHALMIGGTTGEYYVETLEERLKLLQVAREAVGETLPIIFGTGSVNPKDSLWLAERAKDAGATCLLLATPPYSLPTQQELADFALQIDQIAGLPIMLYNYPDRMGINMEPEFFELVKSSKNICGIKESSGDINRLHMLMADCPHIQVTCGMDDQALEFFAWGAKGWVCAGSNFLPKEHIALYQACAVENDFAKGRRIMAAMMPLMSVLEQGGKFIQSVKHGVVVDGRKAGEVRAPLQGLSDSEKIELEAVIKTLKQNIAAIVS